MLAGSIEQILLGLASTERALRRRHLILRAMFAAYLTKRGKAIGRQRIWLFGGSSGKKYADNSAALHKYVRQNHPEIDARWMINRNSPDVNLAKAHGEVLFLDDPDAFLYGLLAEVHVISHGVHDVPACSSRFSKATKVRLGHGLTALVKREPPRQFRFNSLDPIFDLVPVSSEFEAQNKMEWGFTKEKLHITGTARFDELLELARAVPNSSNPRRILFMPTARDSLVGRISKFKGSEYQKSITALLDGVNTFLAAHNTRMWMFVHPLMWDHFEALCRLCHFSQVDMLPLNADLQPVLAETSLFVTDYSSVAWDALYIGKPILFYQFDFDEYFKHRGQGSHLNLKEDLFGPLALDAASAIALVKRYIESNFSALGFEGKMEHWRKRAFVHIDTRNRERIVEAIFTRLAQKTAKSRIPSRKN